MVSSLNKLDVGAEAKTLLSSAGHNDGSLLVVSHRDVREVLERSFEELVLSQQASDDLPPHE